MRREPHDRGDTVCEFSRVDLEGGSYFFNIVKEGDQVTFVTDDEAERTLWVQAIYRATGQSHKPVPPASVSQPSITSNMTLSRMQGGECGQCQSVLVSVSQCQSAQHH